MQPTVCGRPLNGSALPIARLAWQEARATAIVSLALVGDTRVKSNDVRFGSLADIRTRIRDVRFTPKSGHAQRQDQCPLSANS